LINSLIDSKSDWRDLGELRMENLDLSLAEKADVPASRKDSARRVTRQAWWPVAVASLIVFASGHSRVAGPEIVNSDKLVHFMVYGLLATLVCRLGRGWQGAAWALLAVSAFGATDEWHQSFIPGRSCELGDWIADTLGAAVAVLLYAGWVPYRQWLERPLGRRRPGR
jgi:VanZ family protein